MLIILLIFSLALHCLSFWLIILLYQRQQRIQSEAASVAEAKDDIEELLAKYTAEMKKDNEMFIYNMKRQASPEQPAGLGGIQQSPVPAADSVDFHEEESGFAPPVPKTGDTAEASDQSKVLALAAQGKQPGEIAKLLQLGQGEVELFMKFYQADTNR
ncbi:DUF6115 domain-containing protein [Alteribacillus sp. HJP-4]|uniref:DUF6115 domain-containing protein n=1 Tax=Alteribacillus sp. HJP-4 TaxID=2775394 RepID=UPI0035CD0148